MPEPEILDEDAFQSVLDGLEGDILGDEEIAEFAEHEPEVTASVANSTEAPPTYYAEASPTTSYVVPDIFVPENEVLDVKIISSPVAEVEVAAAFDPMADFDAAFDDSIFEDLPVETAQLSYSELSSTDTYAAETTVTGLEFEEIEIPADNTNAVETLPASVAVAGASGLGLSAILGSMRANASRETQATTSLLPATALPTATKPAANAEPMFPDVVSPYDEVPVTGSLKVPDFVASEAVIPQPATDFDDFEIGGFEPSRATTAAVPVAHPAVIVHEQTRDAKPRSDFDELADVDFEDAFNDDFNPTDELADLVGSNVQQDPLFSTSLENGFSPMPAMPPIEAPRSGRGKWLAFGAIGVALVGALAIYGSLGDGTTDGEVPAIVRADNEPVRVAPDNPGGTIVPNQDRVVFNEVGGANSVPEQPQETLVDGRQEPAIASAPVKEEDRVLNGDNSAESTANNGTAIAPRAVQTVTVRPDGTLVVNPPADLAAAAPQAEIVPEVRPEVAAAAPAQPMPEPPVAEIAAAPVAEAPLPAEPVSEAAAIDAPIKEIAEAKVPVRMVELKPVVQKPKVKAQKVQALEAVPSRPSDQPVNIINNDAPAVPEQPAEQQTAAAAPAPQADALAAGNYAIQIASTPSEESAISTLRGLSGKFGSVLGGKDYAIQKAEVPGKGTVFRVRILAGSKADAGKLCARYKSAGGSCFVTR